MVRNHEHLARELGPSLSPGETVQATVEPGSTHNGHTDTYEVHKSESGEVTVKKDHV